MNRNARAAATGMGVLVVLVFACSLRAAAEQPAVTTVRVPDGGIQPQARTDAKGVIHLIYVKGDPAKADVYYVRSTDGAKTFTKPTRVNSQAGSVVAMGTVRGPHLAIGRNGRAHVAWMGSRGAEPRASDGSSPMLYTRLNDAGNAFEPERNLIQKQPGLDGGGSVAADVEGNVYVAWHAPKAKKEEADRHVWVVHSKDDGKTFGPETVADTESNGACGCCGMRIFATAKGDRVLSLYRSATDMVNRDMYLLVSKDHGGTFTSTRVGPWKVARCVMSTAAMAEGSDGDLIAAWEQQEQVYVARIGDGSQPPQEPAPMPGATKGRKHPAAAVNSGGEYVVVWAEGTGWNKGGAVVWQVYGKDGRPIADRTGRVDGLPAWSVPAVVALGDGSFKLLY